MRHSNGTRLEPKRNKSRAEMEHKRNTSIMGWVRHWRKVEESQGCEQLFVIHISRIVHKYVPVNR